MSTKTLRGEKGSSITPCSKRIRGFQKTQLICPMEEEEQVHLLCWWTRAKYHHQGNEVQSSGKPCTATSHKETDDDALAVAASHSLCLKSTLLESAGSLTSKQSRTSVHASEWAISHCTNFIKDLFRTSKSPLKMWLDKRIRMLAEMTDTEALGLISMPL